MYKIIPYSFWVFVLSFVLYQTANIVLEIMADEGEQVPIQQQDDESGNSSAAEVDDLKAVMIGATGATGKYLFAELLKDKVRILFMIIHLYYVRISFSLTSCPLQ